MTYKSFETERLLLKPTTEEDADFIFELFNSPKWLRNIGDRNLKTVQNAQEYIQRKMLPQLHRLGFSNYTIIRKEDQAKIGSCGLYDREGFEGIDIGFALLPPYEKKGYAFEAANKLKKEALDSFGIKEISGITVKNNVASQNLLLRLGLTLSGTTTLPNDDEELLVYKLVF
ncbi:Protein N-acetyltransferase, RimJ/RimL family [Arenibacter nanhaiticus]|uniref:Protein N-acetyltransferase, RimJ/RimL family n=1 Tax=Arenibacter nanhaiticus TaxID=558155 RepID=A0A1M6CQ34_9FLAO|nr:GNAT family N-acetyltransferase [Arenibacter nanhaiticus]SHI63096.1 Protein N-acetyltransferase, RimJ/RimL family [Arenibacter nanhaiticus]